MPEMKRSRATLLGASAVVAAAALAGFFALRDQLAARRTQQEWAALKSYCTDCHNAAEAAGGVVFEGVSADAIPVKAEVFEAAVRKLRGGLMPPPGNPRPDQKHIEAFVKLAESAIDRGAALPRAGHVSAQRLN